MKKKTAAIVSLSAVALGASAGLHNNFSSDELLHSEDYLQQHQEAEYSIRYLQPGELSKADQIRAAFIRLPVAVKVLFLLPLWIIGSIPSAIISSAVASPLVSALLGYVLQAAALFGVFCVVYKLLFPHKKLKDLLKKKNLKWIVAGAGGVTVANWVLSEVWSGWTALRILLMLSVGAFVIAMLWVRICGKFKAPEPKPVETTLQLSY